MATALTELERGNIKSVRRAAEMYGIPQSTLHDHHTGRIQQHVKPAGPQPYLSMEDEEELSNFLINCSRMLPKNQATSFAQY